MRGLQMEKEICTYNRLKEIYHNGKDAKERLKEIAEFIDHRYGVKIYFCKLLGRRWSYYAGIDGVMVPEENIKITDDLGICVEKGDIDQQDWIDILDAIVRLRINL